MLPTRQGSFRLFRLFGIDVFLHWSWFLVAVYEINIRGRLYSSPIFNALEYVALFGIVLMHEFGHSLACRQVGGKADQIVLWPLGGVAYVSPPQRPGAVLWSIAAGPLVNVILFPILTVIWFISRNPRWPDDIQYFFYAIWFINVLLLTFNILPVYPLDGGQMLRSVLWFFLGKAKSLMIAAGIGVAGVAVLLLVAVLTRSVWMGILGVFMLFNCWNGLQYARVLGRVAKMPRHEGYACPECKQPPVRGPYWRCQKCGFEHDPFEHGGVCPQCGEPQQLGHCPECGAAKPFNEWRRYGPGS